MILLDIIHYQTLQHWKAVTKTVEVNVELYLKEKYHPVSGAENTPTVSPAKE